MSQGRGPRLRVLVSAYACAPCEEPEAAAGWTMATAAARSHDVWVITRERFRGLVEKARSDDPELAAHLTVIYLDLPPRIMAMKRRSWDLYWYYAAWQRLMAHKGLDLQEEFGFDVIHHVTWANDWLPCGAARIDGPAFVWGPVGGASRVPIVKLARWLGLRGTVTELARGATTGIPRRIWGDAAARRAGVVVAQNPDVARRFRYAADVAVEPNAAMKDLPPAARRTDDDRGDRRAVFPARLLGWKGGRLALATIARAPGWRLDIYGEGYEEKALRSYARRLGIETRVGFHGHRPRHEVLSALADADAMLFPSMHDQAGWVAAEASALGCPVVCLPMGGPPVLAGPNAHIASLEGDVVANLASKLREAASVGGEPVSSWDAERFVALVDGWYRDAIRHHAKRAPDDAEEQDGQDASGEPAR